MMRRNLIISTLLLFIFADAMSAAHFSGLTLNSQTGAPVAGVSITIIGFRANSSDSIIVSVISNASGVYNAEVPSNAKYYLFARKEGFVTASAGPIYAADTAYVLNFAMAPAGSTGTLISGKVTDNSGQPVAGASLALIPSGMLPFLLTATTLENGTYTFSSVPPGTYILTAEKTGFQRYVYPDSIRVSGAAAVPPINITLIPLSGTTNTTITGKVYNAAINTILPIPGAIIKLTGQTTNTFYSAVSDSTGYYKIPNVIPGIYSAVCAAQGYQSVTKTVTAQGTVTEVMFYLMPSSPAGVNSISGVILDDSLLSVLSGVTVTLRSGANLPALFTATTGTDGKFKFTALPRGSYLLSAEFPGYLAYNVPSPILVDSATIISDIRILLHKIQIQNYALVKGGVYKQTSGALYPISGASIKFTAVNTPASYTAVSDSNGLYSIDNVPYGVYLASCAAAGYTLVSSTVNIQSSILPMNFYMPPAAAYYNVVAGNTLDDSTRQPIANVRLTLSAGLVMPPIYSTISSLNGSFQFSMLPAGNYILQAEKEGYISYRHRDTIHLDSSTIISNLTINMDRVTGAVNYSVIYGKVYKGSSSSQLIPVPNAVVKITGNNGLIFSARSDSIGLFTIREVPYGYYTGYCEAPGLSPQTITFAVQQATTGLVFCLATLPGRNNLLSGYVRDDSTRLPLANAKLTLKPGSIYSFLLTTYSDSTGYFKFLNMVPTVYTLSAVREGYQSYEHPAIFNVDTNTVITDVQVLMKKANTAAGYASIAGSVIGNSPVPVPVSGALIRFMLNDSLCYSARSDSSGNYFLPRVKYGKYIVICAAVNYVQLTETVSVTQPVITRNFYLVPAGFNPSVVIGRVYFDNSNNPVPGAVIEFIPSNSTGNAFTSVTGENGIFNAQIPAGNYIVSCTFKKPESGYAYREYYDNVLNIAQAAIVQVHQNDTIGYVNFGIPQITAGTMYNVTVKGCVRDNANTLLPQAKVSVYMLYYNEPIHATAVTDINGRYEIAMQLNREDTLQNIFAVMAGKEGYKTEFYNEKPSLPMADKFFVFRDTVYKDINFTLDPAGTGTLFSISGKVTGPQAAPLSGAFVIGANAATAELSFAFTDASGKYSIGSLKSGKYYLLFAATGYIPEFYNNVFRWENASAVIVNANVTGINAELAPAITPAGNSSSVAGIVTDQSGNNISNVLVTLNDGNGGAVNYTFSGADGSYEMPGLQPGTYTLTATKVAFSSYSHTFQFNNQMGSVFLHNFILSASPLSAGTDNSQAYIPAAFMLRDNYPNPFNPATNIRYELPAPAEVKITVFNILGNRVQTLVSGYQPAGVHEITWNASSLPSGIYYCEFMSGTVRQVKKMVLTK